MRPQDAPVLAELVNHAGDGLPLHLWSKMAVLGESAWDVGRRRAPRPKAASPVARHHHQPPRRIAGCLIGYALTDQPEPDRR
jgi:hypothetical protein